MRKLLIFIGWLKQSGRIDYEEIIFDVLFVAAAVAIASLLVR